MKRILIIIISLSIILSLVSSCENSLGYDSNVESELVDKDTTNKPIEGDYEIRKLYFRYYEIYTKGNEHMLISRDFEENESKFSIEKIDDKYKIKLKIKASMKDDEVDIKMRKDYVSDFEAEAEITLNRRIAILENIEFINNTDDRYGHKYTSSVKIVKKWNNQIYEMDGKASNSRLIINEFDPEYNRLSGFVTFSFDNYQFNTQTFIAQFDLDFEMIEEEVD